ncbi:MAG TPA: ABC transporter [Desulfobacterales bacterium]|nr:ABC transporter [Desulfobacterales bacterium]
MECTDGTGLAFCQPRGHMVMPLKGFIAIFGSRRELLSELVRRELRDRHSGQILGSVWAFGHPLVLMTVYTLLFTYVFPTRFGEGTGIQDYAGNVLSGIVCWLAFQDLLLRAPSVLVGHSNLVKQVVFPIEVLPVKTSIASALPYSMAVIFTVAYALWRGHLSWFALTLPLIMLCQLAAMMGAAFLLSAAGVFLRDLRDVVQVFCTINLFAQPILYNPFSTPKWMISLFSINPFSYFVWCWQDALYLGGPAHPSAWVFLPLGSITLLAVGWIAFTKISHWFGDAL